MPITLRDSLEPLVLRDSARYSPGQAQGATYLEAQDTNPLTRGWNATGEGLVASQLLAEANAAERKGDIGLSQALQRRAQDHMQQAQAWAPTTQNFDEINSLGSGAEWLAGSVGGGLRSMIAPVAGGALGSLAGGAVGMLTRNPGLGARAAQVLAPAGAFVPGYDMGYNETVGQAMMDPEVRARSTAQDIHNTGQVAGAVSGALDAIVPAGVAKIAVGGMGKRLAGRTIIKDIFEEGTTEGAQNIVGQTAQNQLRGDDLTNYDYRSAFNDAMAGAVAGGAISAGGVGVGKLRDKIAAGGEAVVDTARDPVGKVIEAMKARAEKQGREQAQREIAAGNTPLEKMFQQSAEQAASERFFDPAPKDATDEEVSASARASADQWADKILSSQPRTFGPREGKLREAAAQYKSDGDWLKFRAVLKENNLRTTQDEMAASFDAGEKASEMTTEGKELDALSKAWLANEGKRFGEYFDGSDEANGLGAKLFAWIKSDFGKKLTENGEIFIPRAFVEALGDRAPGVVESAVTAARKEGWDIRDAGDAVNAIRDYVDSSLGDTAYLKKAIRYSQQNNWTPKMVRQFAKELRQKKGRLNKDDYRWFKTQVGDIAGVLEHFQKPSKYYKAEKNMGLKSDAGLTQAARDQDEKVGVTENDGDWSSGVTEKEPVSKRDYLQEDEFFDIRDPDQRAVMEKMSADAAAVRTQSSDAKRVVRVGILDRYLEKAAEERGVAPDALAPQTRDKITRDLVHEYFPSFERLPPAPKNVSALTEKQYRERKSQYETGLKRRANLLNQKLVTLAVESVGMEKLGTQIAARDVHMKNANPTDPKYGAHRGTIILRTYTKDGKVASRPFVTSTQMIISKMFKASDSAGASTKRYEGTAQEMLQLLSDGITSVLQDKRFGGEGKKMRIGTLRNGEPQWFDGSNIRAWPKNLVIFRDKAMRPYTLGEALEQEKLQSKNTLSFDYDPEENDPGRNDKVREKAPWEMRQELKTLLNNETDKPVRAKIIQALRAKDEAGNRNYQPVIYLWNELVESGKLKSSDTVTELGSTRGNMIEEGQVGPNTLAAYDPDYIKRDERGDMLSSSVEYTAQSRIGTSKSVEPKDSKKFDPATKAMPGLRNGSGVEIRMEEAKQRFVDLMRNGVQTVFDSVATMAPKDLALFETAFAEFAKLSSANVDVLAKEYFQGDKNAARMFTTRLMRSNVAIRDAIDARREVNKNGQLPGSKEKANGEARQADSAGTEAGVVAQPGRGRATKDGELGAGQQGRNAEDGVAKQDAWVMKVASLPRKDLKAFVNALPKEKLERAIEVLESFFPVDNTNPFWQRNDLDNYTDAKSDTVFEAQELIRDRLSEDGVAKQDAKDSYSWARFPEVRGTNYEVSSAGDKRFSALNATLKDGRTIEEAYQLDVKGYRVKGDQWRLGKGKPPLKKMSKAELYGEYKSLWSQWAKENPSLMRELAKKAEGKVLTDQFASTDISQARALSELLNEQKFSEQAPDGEAKYSMMSTEIHNSLGKDGFAATHDSPIRHEGKFNWRAHKGKGEGHAAFGAGTYLSTADGVHESYKKQFTAKVSRLTDAQRTKYKAKLEALRDNPDAAELRAEYEAALAEDDQHRRTFNPGTAATYHVTVNIEPEELLDWDNLLGYQFDLPTAVHKAATKAFAKRAYTEALAQGEDTVRVGDYYVRVHAGKIVAIAHEYSDLIDNTDPDFSEVVRKAALYTMTGEDLYTWLAKELGSQAKASDYLQSLGVLGHNYDAAGGSNDTHPNYVIYDDSKIETNYVHFNKQNTTPSDFKPIDPKQALEDLARMLGKDYDAKVVKNLGGKAGTWTKSGIKLAASAPNGTQYHEALHEMFNQMREHGADNVRELIERVASSPLIMRKLEQLLEGHPKAIKQLKTPEEAAAFLFQFWNMGLINVGPETKSLFQTIKDWITNVAKDLYAAVNAGAREKRAGEKAAKMDQAEVRRLFEGLAAGGVADPDTRAAVYDALRKNTEAHQKAIDELGQRAEKFWRGMGKYVVTSETMLNLYSKHPELKNLIADRFHQMAGKSMKNQARNSSLTARGGYIEAVHGETQSRLAKFERFLMDAKFDQKDMELAAKHLEANTQSSDKKIQSLIDFVHTYYGEMYDYATQSDVRRLDPNHPDRWVPLQKRKNYFTQSWSIEELSKDHDGFVSTLLDKHRKELEGMAKQANAELAAWNKNPNVKVQSPTAKNEVERAIAEFEQSGQIIGKLGINPVTPEMIAETIYTRLLNSTGLVDIQESEWSLGITPAAAAVNRRELDWLDKEAFSKYKSKDLVEIVTSYTRTMVKRAEYQKRFGYSGEVIAEAMDTAFLREMGGDKLVDDASTALLSAISSWKKAYAEFKANNPDATFPAPYPTLRMVGADLHRSQVGEDKANADMVAAEETLRPAINAVRAMEGTLGNEIGQSMRSFNSWVNTYQNVRLLPFALFTNFSDVIGITVQGGTLGDAWDAFTSGIREVRNTWVNEKGDDKRTMRAEEWGVSDAGALLDTLGQNYSSVYMNEKARAVNNKFFRIIGMEGWNRGVRITASAVGERVIMNWVSNGVDAKKPGEQARFERLYGEGFDPKSIKLDKDGNLDTSDAANRAAIQRFVQDAVMSSNPAVRATWMSDPRMATFAHLKNFAYAFHSVMLKGILAQVAQGNLRPALVAGLGYASISIAAGAIKEMLIPGDEPFWMQGGLDGYLEYGYGQANLGGVPQLWFDGVSQLDPAKLAGPFWDQIQNTLSAPLPGLKLNLSPMDGETDIISDRKLAVELAKALPAGSLAGRAMDSLIGE